MKKSKIFDNDVLLDIINHVKNGDEKARNTLLSDKGIQRYIYNLAYKYKIPLTDFEDAYQETIIHINEKLFNYDAEKASPKTWLIEIIKGSLHDIKRANEQPSTIKTVSLDKPFRED